MVRFMAYEDVPQRLIDREAVPRSEILAYAEPNPQVATTLTLEYMVMALCMEKIYEDDTVKFRITPFGMQMRDDFITRIEGDCPECP